MIQISASVSISMPGGNNPDASPGVNIAAYILWDGGVIETIGSVTYGAGGGALVTTNVRVFSAGLGNHTAAIRIDTHWPQATGISSTTVTVNEAALVFFEPRT